MRHALLVQMQVVYALIIRETRTRFGRHRLGYIWALISPLMWIGMFGAMYWLMDRKPVADLPVAGFLASGIVPFLLFRESMGRVTSAISANRGLLYYPHIRPLDFVMARGLLELATQVVLLFLLMAGIALFTGQFELDNVLMVLSGMGLASGLGVGIGLVFSGLSVYAPSMGQVQGMVFGRPLFWTSGLFFTSNTLPTSFREIVLYNPVLHAVEITRDGWFPSYTAYYVSFSYPVVWIIGLFFFGLTLERVARRRVQLS